MDRRRLWLLALVFLAGCSAERWRGYGGDPRPPHEVSRLRNELRFFAPSAVIRSFDGVPLTEKEGLRPLDIELLPGEHRLEVEAGGMYGEKRMVTTPLELRFVANAGQQYVVRVWQGEGGGTADTIGYFWRSIHWTTGVFDEATGQRVSEILPRPGRDRAW